MSNYIQNNKKYILAKDQNNNDIDNKTIQDIVFAMILEVDRICRNNNIPYALAFGSALGLYRYGDFIPWDDDADIVINYEDYERFVKASEKELGEDYAIDTRLTNKKYNPFIPTIKIIHKHTKIREISRLTLTNHNKLNGLFIDVCLFMGVPEDKKEHQKLISFAKRRAVPFIIGDAFLFLPLKKARKKIYDYEAKVAEQYKDSHYVSQTVILPFQDYPKSMVNKLNFPRDIIYPFKEYDFRGHKIYSFADIEAFSIYRYGEAARKKKDPKTGEYYEDYSPKKQKSAHTKKIIFKKR